MLNPQWNYSPAPDLGPNGTIDDSTLLRWLTPNFRRLANVLSGPSVYPASGALASGAAITVDPTVADLTRVQLTADCTITLPLATGRAGDLHYLEIAQDATGGRIVTWVNTVFGFPVLPLAPNAKTMLQCLHDGTGWVLCRVGPDFSAVSVGVINAADPAYGGAVPDGITDNAARFNALCAAVNAIEGSAPVEVVIPPGPYAIGGSFAGFTFTREVIVWMTGATLTYAAGCTGYAFKMGADGQTAADEPNNRCFEIHAGKLMGGLNLTHVIYFNAFITEPRVRGTRAVNCGGTNSYFIYAQASNWDLEVWGVSWTVDSVRTIQPRNFLRLEGIYAADDHTVVAGVDRAGTSDIGQSQLRASNNHVLDQSGSGGIGWWINGVQAKLINNNTAGFAPNVHLAAFAGHTSIVHCYFETINGTECIRFGDTDGPYMGDFCQYVTIRDCYCNLHNTDTYATNTCFIGYNTAAATPAGFQYSVVADNTLVAVSPGRVLVRLASLPSQVGNSAQGNRADALFILHTAGGPIDDWTGADEKLAAAAGVLQDSGGIKHGTFATGSVAANSALDFTVTWATAFADANITVTTGVVEATGRMTATIKSVAAASLVVTAFNPTAAPTSGTVHLIVFHK